MFGNIKVLRLRVQAWRRKAIAKIRFFAIFREGYAIHRADIDASVAFDALWRIEYGLHVAVQAALRFEKRLPPVEPELHFNIDVFERDFGRCVRDFVAHVVRNVIGVTPLVYPHLLAKSFHTGRRTHIDVLAVAQEVD